MAVNYLHVLQLTPLRQSLAVLETTVYQLILNVYTYTQGQLTVCGIGWARLPHEIGPHPTTLALA